jgi:hypothetical protein
MPGALWAFFSADHDRLDALLERSVAGDGTVAPRAFAAFRAGILRHIGMEEKYLFPAARSVHAALLPITARLRVDHGAVAALLVPTPTPAIVDDLRSLLLAHNRREEEPGGVYDACDEALGPRGAERLLEELRSFPEPPLKPYNDGPDVMKHIAVTLAAAREQWGESAGR